MDQQVASFIRREEKRQAETLQLIPSENYASEAVRRAMGSGFENKYAEGYPGKRYYQGNMVVDELERLCQDRVKQLFGVPHVNVQPLSGAPANLAVLKALKRNDTDVQLSQLLEMGGHLSMGQVASITSEYMPAVHYGLTPAGEIDWGQLEELAVKHKPRIIWSGGTGYTRLFQWDKYAWVADKVGAYFVADISHIGGLVAGGAHPTPVPFAHVVMTTTHKTLRGPRGAMIMVTDKGMAKDANLAATIDKAVFPGVQGGPHMENIAALCVALAEAATPAFRRYSRQIVSNAQALAAQLSAAGYQLVGGGTQNHMVWVDLTDRTIDGWTAAWGLEFAGMIANRQTVPRETRSAYYPSGLRLGTPAVTSRGMTEPQMKQIAAWIHEVLHYLESVATSRYRDIGSADRATDQAARKRFKTEMTRDPRLLVIAGQVKKLCQDFPVP